jgi:hypothetical protein
MKDMTTLESNPLRSFQDCFIGTETDTAIFIIGA